MSVQDAAWGALLETIIQVKREYAPRLFVSLNVVACGVGFKKTAGQFLPDPCVVVSVSHKLPKSQLSARDLIPAFLGSIQTDVQEVGIFEAQQTPSSPVLPTARCRPVQPGVSCGHAESSAGTLGCLVRRGSEVFILSNNHVLANLGQARKGDAIIQPGAYDGGAAADQIAVLEEWTPLQSAVPEKAETRPKWLIDLLNALARLVGWTGRIEAAQQRAGENVIDCALARPLSPDLVRPDILNIGTPKGIRAATLGMQVQKMGRTTGHTTGQITQVDVSVQVDYSGHKLNFVDQLMATGMSAGGDSGSVVLDMQGYVIGLLFAGSGVATLINPIQSVLRAFKVDVVTG